MTTLYTYLTTEPTPLAALIASANETGFDWLSPEAQIVILQPALGEVLGDEPKKVDKYLAIRKGVDNEISV